MSSSDRLDRSRVSRACHGWPAVFYGRVSAPQAIWRDSKGNLPWEAGYGNPPSMQSFWGPLPHTFGDTEIRDLRCRTRATLLDAFAGLDEGITAPHVLFWFQSAWDVQFV